jgi:hypothetical protein
VLPCVARFEGDVWLVVRVRAVVVGVTLGAAVLPEAEVLGEPSTDGRVGAVRERADTAAGGRRRTTEGEGLEGVAA